MSFRYTATHTIIHNDYLDYMRKICELDSDFRQFKDLVNSTIKLQLEALKAKEAVYKKERTYWERELQEYLQCQA